MRSTMGMLALAMALLSCRVEAAKKVLYTAEPTAGSTDAIDMTFYLKAAGDLHFVVLHDGQTEPTAAIIKNAKQGSTGVAAAQTIEVRKPGRVSHRVSGLAAGTTYDVYFVSEVCRFVAANLSKIVSSLPRTLFFRLKAQMVCLEL